MGEIMSKQRLIDANLIFPADSKDMQGKPVEQHDEFIVTLYKLRRYIKRQPTVDAVPVRHGHWITDDCDAQCSVCKQIFTFQVSMEECHPIDDLQMYYCQNCGAKMDVIE